MAMAVCVVDEPRWCRPVIEVQVQWLSIHPIASSSVRTTANAPAILSRIRRTRDIREL